MSGHFKSMHIHVSLDVCMQDCQRGSSKLQISKVLIVFAHNIIEYLTSENYMIGSVLTKYTFINCLHTAESLINSHIIA